VLVVRREGYGTLVYRFPPNERETSIVDFGEIAMDLMAIVSGTVVDESGKPRPNQTVSLKGSNADRNTRYSSAPKSKYARDTRLDGYGAGRTVRTDDAGRFSFVDLAPGEYVLSATLEGVDAPVEAAVRVAAGARVTDVKLLLDEGLTIEGRVFGPDGNPVEKAGIRTTMPPSKKGGLGTANARTDAQGRFRLVGLTAGTYRLSVLCWDDHAETRFAPAEVEKVTAGTTDVIVRLRNVSRIEGFVREADGTPVPRASVYAYVGGRGTTPIVERGQSDGSFFIDVAEGDVADLEVYPEDVRNADASQRAKRTARADAVDAGTKGVELRLPPR
jgi:protocatechuate 3,4-dioxygenase beta subunit